MFQPATSQENSIATAGVIEFRSFLNTDIHKIVHLWRGCSRGQRVFDSMSASILEDLVFAKPYFDPAGLIVAEMDHEMVGMGLVGFLPTEDQDQLDYLNAVLSRLLIDSSAPWEDVGSGLLQACQKYAMAEGGKTLHYGSSYPHAPFFNGAYGGSLVGGVLEQESHLLEFLLNHGFEQRDQIESFQMLLSDFRPLVNRQQITAKRQCKIVMQADPMPSSWYQACNFGNQNCIDFQLLDRKTNSTCGNLRFWEVQPLSGMWGRRSAGLYFLVIDSELRRGGLATMLLGDAFRQLHELGFASIEVQLPRSDDGLCSLFQKLGFEHIGRSTQLECQLETSVAKS